MTERRSSITQMAQINNQLSTQNETLKQMQKIAEQTNQTTNNIQGELVRQRGVIQNNIEKNKQIKGEVKKADRITNQMRRRQLCITLTLWLVAILLFCANIGLIIWKATTVK